MLLLAGTAGADVVVPDLLGSGRLVAYRPRSAGKPDPAGLRIDARELRRRGFRAITTPATARVVGPVCRFFKRYGFWLVLIDVADPTDRAALGRARRLRRCADGYMVGNGGLAAGRYTHATLAQAVARLRAATNRPVTTREPVDTYAQDAELVTLGDWLFPTANPYDAGNTLPQTACGYSVHRFMDVRDQIAAGRQVVLGETGLPTAGEAMLTENGQRAFLGCIDARSVRYEHFTAFDDPAAGPRPADAHWGLFRADGTPKAWALLAAQPRLLFWRDGTGAHGLLRNASPELYRVAIYTHGTGWGVRSLVPLSRRGKWRTAGDVGAALLVARSFVPAPSGDRLPQVDGASVFAVGVDARQAAGGAR